MKDRVLIVDDEASLRTLLTRALTREGYEVEAAASITELRAHFNGTAPDVVLLDWKLPDGDGIEILPGLKAQWPETQVIILTGMGTFDAAVEATKRGAFHFLGKPFQAEVLSSLLRRACEFKHLHDRAEGQRQVLSFLAGGASPTFQSACMREVLRQVEKLADSDDSVLISGESGSGKEVIAQMLHTLGPRVTMPLRKLDCASAAGLTSGNFEWELFGSAGTASEGPTANPGGLFFEAGRGTAVLDEITTLGPAHQEVLVGALWTRRFTPFGAHAERTLECRVLATTSLKPDAAVATGGFREDLLRLLAAHRIHVPPLRERRDDILPLANAFLTRFGSQARQSFKGFTPKAARYLENFDWPGNVRQLENTIQSVCLTVSGGYVDEEHLPYNVRMEVAKKTVESSAPAGLRLARRN